MAPSPEADDPVEELISRAVQELEQRGDPGLQEFLARHATHAAAVRDGLERLRRLGILAPPPAAPLERAHYGEFRVLRRIGTGGMGVVYAAEQTSLQRTVALKVVRPEFLLSQTARDRFRREVEAIARLQHPGIVPILAVGNEDTQPWFAMEYVDGRTLEEMLAGMRGKDPARADGNALRQPTGGSGGSGSGASAVFAGSYWEACARLVQQVAATMAYVHEQGIVHRDLKPSNIVVTKQGQALVLDFGLAHVRDLQRVTHDDKPLGTPAYVSPEQVRGEAIDERVDVYGLGVTLYELLTTHLPFENESWESLQSAILAGNARPVRSWNRAIPRDLEIVCAMAIDRDRARRYRSMADFAADLEAVLARRPIRARPLGPGLRLVRFAQRHPAWAATAGALLVVALQFPLLLWQQEAAAKAKLTQTNQELEQSNRELAWQRRIAVDNYNDALDAVQQVLVGSAQGELVVAPGNERTQLAILRRAEAMYERLREKRPDHRRLAFDSARNLQHIGNQLGRLGDVPGAEAAYRDALLRCAPWNGADFHYLRGSIARFLGIALDRRGARDEAVAAYEQAHCELAAAWPHFPGDRVVRRQFAEAIASLGKARQRTDPAGALTLLQQAQTHKEALLADEPRDLAGALACALGCSHLADLLAEREPAAAEAHATRGIDILSTFPPTGKEEGTLRQRLAGLHDTRGTLREAAQRPAEAEQDHGCALALRAGLAHDFPAVAQYRFEVACSRNNLAMVQRHLAGSEAAVTLYAEALADFEQAVRMAPTNVEYGRGLAAASQNHAQLLLELRRLDELAEALGVLGERSKEPPAQLAVARLALQLARQLTARDGDAAAGRAAHWRERAVDCIAAAIANGWKNRAHFETSGQARAYDDLRTHDRFLDLLDTLPTAGG